MRESRSYGSTGGLRNERPYREIFNDINVESIDQKAATQAPAAQATGDEAIEVASPNVAVPFKNKLAQIQRNVVPVPLRK